MGVNILSKDEQSRSISGKKSKKNSSVKTALGTPFEVKWPIIPEKQIELIRNNLKESLVDLNFHRFSPHPRLVNQLESAERRERIKTYENEAYEKAVSEGIIIKHTLENCRKIRSEIIIGYNAVMRSLEKEIISCVFVNKSTQPIHLVEDFIPLCSRKSIPLIPVPSLHDITGPIETLGLAKCTVMGLKNTSYKSDSFFHQLYLFACRITKIDHVKEMPSSEEDSKSKKTLLVPKPIQQPSIDVSKYLLIRSNPNEPAFRPIQSSNETSSPLHISETTYSEVADNKNYKRKFSYISATCQKTIKNPKKFKRSKK